MLHFCVKTPVLATRIPDPTQPEVEGFLRRLHTFMGKDRPNIIIEARPENRQGLFDLRLDKNPAERIDYITKLKPFHACQQLKSDSEQEAAHGRYLWVFGMLVGKAGKKQRPAYVKIQLGHTVADPVCISFHAAQFPLRFLFPSDHSEAFQIAYDEQSSHR